MTNAATDSIAPISRRAVSYLIDALIAGGIAIVGVVVLSLISMTMKTLESLLSFAIIGYGLLTLVLLAWWFVYTWMQTGAGSIGMRAQGLRLASEDGAPLSFGRALLRNLVFGLAASVVVGYFTPLFDGSGRFQGWHDKVARSLMLDARGAAPASGGFASAAVPAAPAPGVPVPQVPAIPGIPAPAQGAPFAAPSAPAAYPGAAPLGGYSAPSAPAAPGGWPSPAVAAQTATGGQDPYAAPAAAPSPAPASPAPLPQAEAAPVADAGPVIAYVPGVSRPAPQTPSVAAAPAPTDLSLDETVVQRPQAPVPAAEPVASTPVTEIPVAPAVVDQQPPAFVPPAHVASEPSDADDVEDTRISIPGHRLIFTWDDGTRVPVSRRTVFGRNPAPEDGVVVVPVRDETLSLSKTHFEAASESSGGWVLDRHSTNGMTIVRNGQRIACPAGQRVPVRLGDAIEIGDRIVTIGGYA
ncbi:MAG: RDD family protein [Microbacterium sp.]|nr:RDD family protein [Microbacterium sp.]